MSSLLLLMINLPVFTNSDVELTLVQKITQISCDKQLVVLGELPSHGEALGFQTKADVVQQLVEQCGFTALFFEAPMYDFLGLQQAINQGEAKPEQLDMAIGGFWITQELTAWRQWLFNQATTKDFFLAGLDDQISATSAYARKTLPQLMSALFSDAKGPACVNALKRNLTWSYDDEHQFNQAEEKLLLRCTQQAANQLSGNANLAVRDRKMIENMANLYARNNNLWVAFDRDDAMYQNFQWQFKTLKTDSKVIVWTANVHAARAQGKLRDRPLGNRLHEQWQDNMVVIGFTALSGQSSMAGMPVRNLSTAPANALEAQSLTHGSNWQLLDAAELNNLGALPSRLFGRFITTNWDSYFDAVVVFRTEKAPTFKPQK